MNLSLRFRLEVVADLEAGACWYDERGVGLGGEFLEEARLALERIVQQPEQAAPDGTGIRSVRMHRFPYVIHYRIEGAMVVVFAIMFGGRDPSVWKDRM